MSAAFKKRCIEACGDDEVHKALITAELKTFSDLAFACGTPQSPPDETAFNNFALKILGGPSTMGKLAQLKTSFRSLYLSICFAEEHRDGRCQRWYPQASYLREAGPGPRPTSEVDRDDIDWGVGTQLCSSGQVLIDERHWKFGVDTSVTMHEEGAGDPANFEGEEPNPQGGEHDFEDGSTQRPFRGRARHRA